MKGDKESNLSNTLEERNLHQLMEKIGQHLPKLGAPWERRSLSSVEWLEQGGRRMWGQFIDVGH
jgi:hypothetical protein